MSHDRPALDPRVRRVLTSPPGARFSRSRPYTDPPPAAPPDAPRTLSPHARAGRPRDDGDLPPWLRQTAAHLSPAARDAAPTSGDVRELVSARRHRLHRPGGSSRPRARRPRGAWHPSSRAYRRLKRRTLRNTGGLTFYYFAAYEMLPYSCSILAVLLLARLLDLLP
ncbi:hypothetical protein [Nocardiopsis composta]|uniref:Uncharacterized protein n=1 Tax=Nocardiopsis composta TaxID=157465 RepID=A0A7W8VFY1_9ACTN|nr:hypothetical protein [Nocardiopsis composta]MBB5434590.1 hypothetical protein [Nocardiopsis composta]